MLAATLVVLALALMIVLWGQTVFVQGWLYETVTDQLPLRAAVGGLAIALFLTFWTYVNTRADYENKYGTFFDYQTVAVREVPEFQAVRYYRTAPEGGTNEQTVRYTRDPAGEFRDPAGIPFRLTTSDYMTVAVLAGDRRYEAEFQTPIPADPLKRVYHPDKLFKEKGGGFVAAERPWVTNTPSTGSLLGAMFLHLFLLLVWLAAFWPVLRYTMWHSILLAFLFSLICIAVMPLVFKKNTRVMPPPAAQPRTSLAVPPAAIFPASIRQTC